MRRATLIVLDGIGAGPATDSAQYGDGGSDTRGFLFANVVELDRRLPRLLDAVREEDLVIFSTDHGNDPTTPSTDHSREAVPLLVYGPRVRPVSLGVRRTLADVGQTVAEFLGAAPLLAGTSFLPEVRSD